MTCIVGIVWQNKIHLGCDSYHGNNNHYKILDSIKIYKNGLFIMGHAGSSRFGQILRYAFEPPNRPKDYDNEKYLSTLFIDELRECMSKCGYQRKDDEVESIDSLALIGYRGRLWILDRDYSISMAMQDGDAIGSGHIAAKAGMHIAKKTLSPEDPLYIDKILYCGLESSEYYTPKVKRPFYYLNSKGIIANGLANGLDF